MSCKLGMLTGWGDWIGNWLKWTGNADFITDTAVSVEIINGANS